MNVTHSPPSSGMSPVEDEQIESTQLRASVSMLHDSADVMTGCQVRSGRLMKVSKGVNEHLCSESGAGLNSQAGDKMY